MTNDTGEIMEQIVSALNLDVEFAKETLPGNEHYTNLEILLEDYASKDKRIAVLRAHIKEACNMLSTLGDQMHETAEDRHEIEEFIARAASTME